MTRFLLLIALLIAPAVAVAGGAPQSWRPIPTSLWAVQAFVPPGTTDARAVQMVPTGVPGVGIPVAVPPAQPGAAPGIVPAPPGGGLSVPMNGVRPALPGTPNIGGGKPGIGAATPVSATVPSAAPIVPTKLACEITLRLGRMDMPPEGGEFLLPVVLKPAACPSSVAFAAAWLKLTDHSQLRFAVEPNTTSAVREALILIADRSFLLRQMPQPQPGLAAAPSRLNFGVNKEGQTDTKVLATWAEGPSGTLIVRAAHPWLQVTPKKTKDGQKYEITVRAKSGLAPGRHDSQIEVVASGTPTRSLVIPVVVEVEGIFY